MIHNIVGYLWQAFDIERVFFITKLSTAEQEGSLIGMQQ
jgi:hypothetical protein